MLRVDFAVGVVAVVVVVGGGGGCGVVDDAVVASKSLARMRVKVMWASVSASVG